MSPPGHSQSVIVSSCHSNPSLFTTRLVNWTLVTRVRPKEFLQKQKELIVRCPVSAETRKKQKAQIGQKLTERIDFLQKQPLSVRN